MEHIVKIDSQCKHKEIQPYHDGKSSGSVKDRTASNRCSSFVGIIGKTIGNVSCWPPSKSFAETFERGKCGNDAATSLDNMPQTLLN
jgi:hypothetical protein